VLLYDDDSETNCDGKDSLGTRPSENWKEGLGDRLRQKCTMRPECRRTSNWFKIEFTHAFNGTTNHNMLKETENRRISWQEKLLEHG